MNRDEIFARSKKERQKEREEEAQRGQGGSGTFEQVSYTALEQHQLKVVRILGYPLNVRDDYENAQFSPKLIQVSWIIGDNGKPFRCIWPNPHDDPSWIMWRIFNMVTAGRWDSEKNEKVFDHKGTHPRSWQTVAKNGKTPDTLYYNMEKGWKPSSTVIMNVIDRERMDWHQSEGKTFLLSKRVSTKTNNKGETTYFYDTGVPRMVYDQVWDTIVESQGDFQNYDVGIVKLTESPWYQVYHVAKQAEFLTRFDPNVVALGTENALTDEERMWKQWDIDKLFPVTSYQKLKNRLSATIQMIDKDFGKNFLEELEELAIKEKAERNQNAGHSVNDEGDATFDPDEIEAETRDEIKVPAPPVRESRPTARPTRKPTSANDVAFDPKSLDPDTYKGISSLSDELLNMIIGVNPNGTLIYEVPPNIQTYECNSCQFPSPHNFDFCPKCGAEFA